MQSYTYLSDFYDLFMDNLPYNEWTKFIISTLKAHNVDNGLILDLGCGTGIISEKLSEYGYELIGIDNSEEMLSVALDKKYLSGHDILYLCQDMREFELYGTVKAVVCICDSLNYILKNDELVKIFQLVNNYLDPKGLFIFDITTEKKFDQIADCVIAENREECSFIWENSYEKTSKINQYDLTLFIKDDNGKYDKVEETHIQKVYTLDEIKEALNLSGLEFIGEYHDFTNQPPNEDSERICIIARECGKK